MTTFIVPIYSGTRPSNPGGAPAYAAGERSAKARAHPGQVVMPELETEDPGFLVLPRPRDGSYTSLMVSSKQDFAAFPSRVHGVGFIQDFPGLQSLGDWVIRIGDLNA